MLIAAGTVLEGKYRISRLLGAGGMGSVWIAEHAVLGRPLAVKVLDKTAANRDATAVQRFLREAQTAARLRSDHIVDVLDVGSFDDGTPFLVMELLEGESLAQRIQRVGRLHPHDAANLVDQLLDALGAAHGAGVIHRDIKPDNCFITTKGGRDHLKLLDFGISKVAPPPGADPSGEMRMTRTGVVMGTPYYMAPEQARGSKEIDDRCDLYAAGAILYECVTGRVPFEADSVNELLFKIVLEPLVPPRALAPELDPAFEQVVLRAMAREAGARFQTAQAFRDALAPYVGPGRISTGTVVDRVVVPTPRSVIPPGSGNPAPISGIEQTAPLDGDAIRAMAMAAPPSTQTPSGLQGLAATGSHHLSETPPKKRGVLFAAIGVTALALAGGALWVTTRGSKPVDGASSAAAATTSESAQPTPSTTASATAEATAEPKVEPKPVAPPEPTPEPKAAAKPEPKGATKTPKVVDAGKKQAAPSVTAANPPPPPPASTTKGGSPRPIDTAL